MNRIEIGPRVRVDSTGMDERPVTVTHGGREYSSRCFFRVVNGGAVFSVGECSEEAFNGICAVFDHAGPKKLARILAGGNASIPAMKTAPARITEPRARPTSPAEIKPGQMAMLL